MYRPRVFISAVSKEFQTLRRQAADVLFLQGYEPVTQDLQGTDPGKLLDVLKEKIDSCDGLIQIIGIGYGSEPPSQEIAGYGRVSYTQFEFLYANDLKEKKTKFETWVFTPREACTRDTPIEELDLNKDQERPLEHQSELRTLQEDYLDKLRREGHRSHSPEDDSHFKYMIIQLKDELKVLRCECKKHQEKVVSSQEKVVSSQEKVVSSQEKIVSNQEKIVSNQDELLANQKPTKDRILGHLIAAADRVKDEAFQAADGLKTYEERESAKEEARQAYENSVARTKRLAEEFAVLEGTQKRIV